MCLSRPQFVAWISTMLTLPGTGLPGSNVVKETEEPQKSYASTYIIPHRSLVMILNLLSFHN